jgi:hypothetical protein
MAYQVHDARALSGLEHRARLADIPGEGLFAQDVTATRYGNH